jgi:bifunctional non-homologous end joining protein LigD
MKSTTLYFKEGSSDKVYQASIEPKGSGFLVNFVFGRRGSTLNTGTKTQEPVDLASAEKLFEKLVREKKAKGYTEGENSTPYAMEHSREYSGIQPQLLNPIDEDQLERYIASPEWAMQEKFDGKRLLLLKQGNAVRGINRKGLFVGIPESIQKDALRIEGDFLIDGEAVGGIYYSFDMLIRRCEDLRHLSYGDRLESLEGATAKLGVCPFLTVSTCHTEQAKREHLTFLRRVNAEGVVFKDVNAPYTSGRPNSGGTQLKCKLYATASFIVAAVNKQRSVRLSLFNEGKQVPAGNVTVPVNQSIPLVGDVVEVRYLYALQQSGSVYQPTLLGRREDIDPQECTVSQLKFKNPSEQEAD